MISRSTASFGLVVALSVFPGMAPSANAQSAPAVATTSHLITAADYPRASIRLREQGTVGVAYTINADGTVSDCTETHTSGKPRLDEAACRMVIRRWRYKPATEDGKPVPVSTTANIVFQFRRGPPGNELALGQEAVTRKDYAEALALWMPLAEQGNPAARAGLGVLYANGQGVAQNYAEAAMWYQLAATQGFAFAQLSLGLLYERGQGVPENPLKALMWFTLASRSTDDIGMRAAQNNERLRQRMAQPQIDEVDAMVARCRQSQYKDCG